MNRGHSRKIRSRPATSRLIPALFLVIIAWLAGCAVSPHATGGWMRSELYFGLSMPGGKTVGEGQWENFLAEEVTPRFPDGLTVISAKGQWRNPMGTLIREDTKVLIIYHPGTPEINRRIEALRAAYLARFDQESVLLVQQPAMVSF
jgi:hypothetical protein